MNCTYLYKIVLVFWTILTVSVFLEMIKYQWTLKSNLIFIHNSKNITKTLNQSGASVNVF